MHGALKLSGMIVKPRFVTQISSTAGPYASKANEVWPRIVSCFSFELTAAGFLSSAQILQAGCDDLSKGNMLFAYLRYPAGFTPTGSGWKWFVRLVCGRPAQNMQLSAEHFMQAIMKAANMSEYGGFDYTFTFGMKRGAVQTAAIGAPILNTITQYVYHEVTEVSRCLRQGGRYLHHCVHNVRWLCLNSLCYRLIAAIFWCARSPKHCYTFRST